MTVWHQKEAEFLDLVQGNLSVTAYEAKFTELVRFSLDVIANESARARKFQRGLKFGIRSKLAPFLLSQYSDMVYRALVIEHEYEDFKKGQDQRKHPRPSEIPKLRVAGHNFHPPRPTVPFPPSYGLLSIGLVASIILGNSVLENLVCVFLMVVQTT